MQFKEFIQKERSLYLEEDGSGDSSDQFGYQLIYPVYADDAKWALNDARKMYFFQWGVSRGLKHGRKLHNIDNKQLQNIGFKSVKSLTAPDTSPGFWEHKPDKRANLEVEIEKELTPYGVSKNSKERMILNWDKQNPGGFGYDLNNRRKNHPKDL